MVYSREIYFIQHQSILILNKVKSQLYSQCCFVQRFDPAILFYWSKCLCLLIPLQRILNPNHCSNSFFIVLLLSSNTCTVVVFTLQGDNGIFGDFTVVITLASLLRDLTLIFCFSYVVYLMNINIQPKGIYPVNMNQRELFYIEERESHFLVGTSFWGV